MNRGSSNNNSSSSNVHQIPLTRRSSNSTPPTPTGATPPSPTSKTPNVRKNSTGSNSSRSTSSTSSTPQTTPRSNASANNNNNNNSRSSPPAQAASPPKTSATTTTNTTTTTTTPPPTAPRTSTLSDSLPTIKIKTKTIERGIAWRTIPNVLETQSMTHEKEELNELNSRLASLLNLLKTKKAENDLLESEINNFKKNFPRASDVINTSPLGKNLHESRRELNDLSNENTINKVRLARNMYELDQLKEKLNRELDLQSIDKLKISNLEVQNNETIQEINSLKENLGLKQDYLDRSIAKYWELFNEYRKIAEELDKSLENRINVEIDIQSLLEKRNFEIELFKLMKAELEKLFLLDTDGKKLIDFERFYATELQNIRDKIRDDFLKMNEFNLDDMKREYETRYTKYVEEILPAEQAAQQANLADEEALKNLNNEFNENKANIKDLKDKEADLKKTLDELLLKLRETQFKNEQDRNSKDVEIAILEDQLRQIKSDSWNLLNFSKNLDSEIAIYDRLLNERFNKYVNEMKITLPNDNVDAKPPVFSFEKYKQAIFGKEQPVDQYDININKTIQKKPLNLIKQIDEDESRFERFVPDDKDFNRKDKFNLDKITIIDQELRELRRHQDDMEKKRRERREKEEQDRIKRQEEEAEREKQRKLRELEAERERQRKLREQEELEKKLRLQREEEERLRKQREDEERSRRLQEAERLRREAEEREKLRLKQIQEEQERLRKEKEEAERKRKDAEEKERQRKLQEEQERLRKEKEEAERKRKEAEEKEKQRKLQEEQERLRKSEEERKRKEQEAKLYKPGTLEIVEVNKGTIVETKPLQPPEKHQVDQKYQIEYEEIEKIIQLTHEEELNRARQKQLDDEELKLKARLEELDQQALLHSQQGKPVKNVIKYRLEEVSNIQPQPVPQKPGSRLQVENGGKVVIYDTTRQFADDDERKRQEQIEISIKYQQEIKRVENEKRLRAEEEARKKQLEKERKEYEERIKREQEEAKRMLVQVEENRLKQIEADKAKQLAEKAEYERRVKIELENIEREQRLWKQQQEAAAAKKKAEEEKKRLAVIDEEKRLKLLNDEIKRVKEAEEQKKLKQIEEEQRRVKLAEEERLRQIEINKKVEHERRVKQELQNIEREQQLWFKEQEERRLKQQRDEEERRRITLLEEEEKRKRLIEEKNNKAVTKKDTKINIIKEKRAHGLIENYVDHCISSSSGRKHVLILSNELSSKNLGNLFVNKEPKADKLSKYALKHKANRYVSGAIGILETSVNGEYIILENLSSSKTVNLKGWYLHRYVPDQSINIIYKFKNDIWLKNGEKLRIWSEAAAKKYRDSFVFEASDLVAEDVINWGVYSKYSVTKLINSEGIDKAVLTQSLLRLSASTHNISLLQPLKRETIEYSNVETTTTTTTTTTTSQMYNQQEQASSSLKSSSFITEI